MSTPESIKRNFDRITTDVSGLEKKEKDLKVLSEEVAKLKSKIRDARSILAFNIDKHPDNKLIFNCGDHVLILKSERCEKRPDEPQHKGFLLIAETGMFS